MAKITIASSPPSDCYSNDSKDCTDELKLERLRDDVNWTSSSNGSVYFDTDDDIPGLASTDTESEVDSGNSETVNSRASMGGYADVGRVVRDVGEGGIITVTGPEVVVIDGRDSGEISGSGASEIFNIGWELTSEHSSVLDEGILSCPSDDYLDGSFALPVGDNIVRINLNENNYQVLHVVDDLVVCSADPGAREPEQGVDVEDESVVDLVREQDSEFADSVHSINPTECRLKQGGGVDGEQEGLFEGVNFLEEQVVHVVDDVLVCNADPDERDLEQGVVCGEENVVNLVGEQLNGFEDGVHIVNPTGCRLEQDGSVNVVQEGLFEGVNVLEEQVLNVVNDVFVWRDSEQGVNLEGKSVEDPVLACPEKVVFAREEQVGAMKQGMGVDEDQEGVVERQVVPQQDALELGLGVGGEQAGVDGMMGVCIAESVGGSRELNENDDRDWVMLCGSREGGGPRPSRTCTRGDGLKVGDIETEEDHNLVIEDWIDEESNEHDSVCAQADGESSLSCLEF